MKLPIFVTKGNKIFVGALMYAVSYAGYYLTNHHNFLEPRLLPFTWVDSGAPFLPYTVLVYMSEYFYFAFVYILLSNSDNINKYLYSFFTLQLFSCSIFMIVPTIYPRELFPVPADAPHWLAATWAWLRHTDAATNCFPSLHVSSVFLSAFVFWTDKQKKYFWIFLAWSTLIALSTLTTKQHYVWDIVSGLGLALVFYRWFHFSQNYERVYGEELNAVQIGNRNR